MAYEIAHGTQITSPELPKMNFIWSRLSGRSRELELGRPSATSCHPTRLGDLHSSLVPSSGSKLLQSRKLALAIESMLLNTLRRAANTARTMRRLETRASTGAAHLRLPGELDSPPGVLASLATPPDVAERNVREAAAAQTPAARRGKRPGRRMQARAPSTSMSRGASTTPFRACRRRTRRSASPSSSRPRVRRCRRHLQFHGGGWVVGSAYGQSVAVAYPNGTEVGADVAIDTSDPAVRHEPVCRRRPVRHGDDVANDEPRREHECRGRERRTPSAAAHARFAAPAHGRAGGRGQPGADDHRDAKREADRLLGGQREALCQPDVSAVLYRARARRVPGHQLDRGDELHGTLPRYRSCHGAARADSTRRPPAGAVLGGDLRRHCRYRLTLELARAVAGAERPRRPPGRRRATASGISGPTSTRAQG